MSGLWELSTHLPTPVRAGEPVDPAAGRSKGEKQKRRVFLELLQERSKLEEKARDVGFDTKEPAHTEIYC